MEKRDFVIKELIDTERNYVDVLFKLKKNFMKPLQAYLDEESHSTIFYKVSVSFKRFSANNIFDFNVTMHLGTT